MHTGPRYRVGLLLVLEDEYSAHWCQQGLGATEPSFVDYLLVDGLCNTSLSVPIIILDSINAD